MPSLRQKVTTYFRQLSFIAEPRDGPRSPRSKRDDDDGNFITKYLEGRMDRIFIPGPEIFNSQVPSDLPNWKIRSYPTGPAAITAACTGPDEGLTGIKRSKLHLSASYADDIDFIDTIQENDCYGEVRRSVTNNRNNHHSKFGRFSGGGSRKSGATAAATTPTSDQNANKTPSTRSRRNSRTSISNLGQKAKDDANSNDPGKSTTIVVSMVSSKATASTTSASASDRSSSVGGDVAVNSNQNSNKNLMNAKWKTDELERRSTDIDCKGKIKATTTTASPSGPLINAQSNDRTGKLLEDTTERLLREAVSNQSIGGGDAGEELMVDSIAGVSNWKMESECAYGISVSLYETNMLSKEPMGHPIADCYGLVARGEVAAMALADGVNWGDGARLAARSAVHGCLDYLDRAIFGMAQECLATTTQEVFVSLLRSLWEGHGCILEVGGALSTLTVAVILPLADDDGKYVVCACNVGDSLGYVYSKKHGVREFTQASHDITSMRDMRDALGALGPADGNQPELSNLTLTMTTIEKGDIVFLTSDGVSDNFDPVVGKFAEAWTPDVKLMTHSRVSHGGGGGGLAPKRQNKSASSIYARLHRGEHPTANASAAVANPPTRPQRTKKSLQQSMPLGPSANNGSQPAPSRPKYLRSHTVIEPRRLSSAGHVAPNCNIMRPIAPAVKIPKSAAGLPLVTGPQRHALTLYRLEDLLSYGINGTFSPCESARRLCHLLIDFVRMITSARRKTLEQRELFYKLASGPDGVKREVELNRMQHRAARKRIVDSSAFTALPGKLDHATVVAYTVGGGGGNGGYGKENTSPSCHIGTGGPSSGGNAPLQSKEFQETNF